MSKKTMIMGGVLVVLIALAFLYEGPIKKWEDSTGKPTNPLEKFDMGKLGKIELTKAGKTTTLEKKDDKWKVASERNFAADQTVIDNLTADLGKLRDASLELVSSNKDKQKDFETSETGLKLKLIFVDSKQIEMIIGKMGNDFSSSYISWANSSDTYLVKVNVRQSADVPEWRDKKIFVTDRAKLAKIRFQFPKSQFTIEKTANNWVPSSNPKSNLASSKVDKVIDAMANLQAAEIPVQDFKGTGLEKNSIIVQATGDGVDNTLMIGDKAKIGDFYYAKKGDSDNIYLITKAQRDTLNTSINSLK
jgi:hypothetical protein